MSFLQSAADIYSELVEMRRFLHQNPEVGSDVPITAGYIKQKLVEFGCDFTEPIENHIVVLLGKGGKTVLVRADCDALPTRELTGLPYASQNGCSHSCGHDIHTSSMLGAIKLLKARESELEGTIKFVFQPDEERILGAIAIIEAGVMENPHVDAVLGMHTAAGLKTGMFNVDAGGYLASSDIFRITVTGKAAHGSMPERGIDPIIIAAKIINEAQTITSRMINALYPIVITFGSIHAGDTANIIPDKAVLEGTIRAFDLDCRKVVNAKLGEIAKGIAELYGATGEFQLLSQTPVTYNDPEMTAEILGFARELLGEEKVRKGSLMLKASDDFAYFSELVPGVMYHIGMGDQSEGYTFPLHNPRVQFNEKALIESAACYAYLPYRWLQKNK